MYIWVKGCVCFLGRWPLHHHNRLDDLEKQILKYEELMEALKSVDVSRIEEDDDETDLSGELACAGLSLIHI